MVLRYLYRMKRTVLFSVCLLLTSLSLFAQERTVENRPYTDLRPFHFGILVGTHLQDLEFTNVGPQVLTSADGTTQTYSIGCDQDRWDEGFQVGVLGEFRLTTVFQLRIAPTLSFGSRHITFKNYLATEDEARVTPTQTMKTVYFGCSFDLIFAAQRFNNHRPYLMAGFQPVVNLTGRSNDYLKLNRTDSFLECGVGCDFYLPYFKLRPELKFMYGLSNCLDTKHSTQLRDEAMIPYASAVSAAHSKMIVLTFYFE